MTLPSVEKSKRGAFSWSGFFRILVILSLLIFLVAALYIQLQQNAAHRAQLAKVLGSGWQTGASNKAGYQKIAALPIAMKEARALAVAADDTIYVAGDQLLSQYTLQGEVREVSLPQAPYCLAVGADNTIYVGFLNEIACYDRSLKLKARWPSFGKGSYLTSLAVSDVGVYAGDAGNRVVHFLSFTSVPGSDIGRGDARRHIPSMVVPSPHLDVAVGHDGLLRVTNPGRHLIETFTPAGALSSSWGEASSYVDGFFGCCNPTDIALYPDGRVITAEKGATRVKVYRADGTFVGIVAGEDAFSHSADGLDLAIDTKEHILVLDRGKSMLSIYASDKKL